MVPVSVAYGITIVTWASAFPMIRVALDGYAPVELALLRFTVASVVLGVHAAVTGMRLPPPGDLLRMGGLGVLGLAGYSLSLAYGQQHVPAGAASFLIATSPIWMLVIAAVAAGERPRARVATAMGVSLAGVALIAAGSGKGFGLDVHALAILVASVLQAVMAIAQRPLIARYGAVTFTTVIVWGATLALLPAAGGAVAAIETAPVSSTLAVLYLGLVPGILGSMMWGFATARSSAAAAGTALYLVPVAAMVLARVFLGEVPAPLALSGALLVLAGVATASSRPASPSAPRSRRRPPLRWGAPAPSSATPRSGSHSSLPTT